MSGTYNGSNGSSNGQGGPGGHNGHGGQGGPYVPRPQHGTGDPGPELGSPEDLYALNRERRAFEEAFAQIPDEGPVFDDADEVTNVGAVPRRVDTLSGIGDTAQDIGEAVERVANAGGRFFSSWDGNLWRWISLVTLLFFGLAMFGIWRLEGAINSAATRASESIQYKGK